MNNVLDVLLIFGVLLLPISTVMLSFWLINSIYDLKQFDKEVGPIPEALSICNLVFSILFATLTYFFFLHQFGPSGRLGIDIITTILVAIFATWGVSFVGSEMALLLKKENKKEKTREV